MTSSDEFRPVTRTKPCAICGKPDWCRRSASGAHECHRVTDDSAGTHVRVAVTSAGFGVYRLPPAASPQPPPSRARAPKQAKTDKKFRVFPSPEAAAADFARWKQGTVEKLHQWTADWFRARIKLPDGKTFCEITRCGDGWVQRAPERPHPLFRVRELSADGLVLVGEGEKVCDAAWLIGLPCVTSGAADSADLGDWSPLAGRDLAILPDYDVKGRGYAVNVARLLQALDQPARVRIVELPGLREKEDLYDFIHEHRDGQDAEAIRAEILSLVAATPDWQEDPRMSPANEEWPDPQPLPDELPPVAPFDFARLPATLSPWIVDIAERIQCPPDFPAVAAMIMLAAVVGRKLGIRPKRQDDWLAVPNLWGVVIGPPSVMKTPAIQEVLRPLQQIEIEAKRDFDRSVEDHDAALLVNKQRRRRAEADIREALVADDGDPLAIARSALAAESNAPTRRRYLVNDSTVEKLGELLNENPNGLLVFRDELIGLLKSLEKEGQEGARSFYLEAWNGTGPFTYDRILRGTVDIKSAIVSVLGSIQPGPLRAYLAAAVAGNEGADGLMQRFQLAVYPDISKEWRNVDRWPDSAARQTVWELIRRLDSADPLKFSAEIDEGDPHGIPFLRFAESAQLLFDDWRAVLESRLRDQREHPVIVAHLAKYRSLIPSLALLIHLVDGPTGRVTLGALERAIAWSKYLESHARRIYAVAIAPDTAEAIALAKKISAGELPEEFALRDVYRPGWVGLSTREAAARAVDVLADLDWLTECEEQTPGRKRKFYRVNPKVTDRKMN